jgi:poly-beta-hydroxyalkanoate depolymerase
MNIIIANFISIKVIFFNKNIDIFGAYAYKYNGKHPEIIENNYDGFLYDNEIMAVELIKELISNKKLYKKISNNSKISAKSKFSKIK